jgi:hypothetical protein
LKMLPGETARVWDFLKQQAGMLSAVNFIHRNRLAGSILI